MSIFNHFYTRVEIRHAECCEGDDDGYVYQVQTCTAPWYNPFKREWCDKYKNDVYRGARRELHHAESLARTHAAGQKGTYVGVHDSTLTKEPTWLKKQIRKISYQLRGEQGIPGMQGPMGMRGPAYDDLECPHCRRYRSQTGAYLLMEAEVGGVFSYTCAHQKCKQKSLWKPINGVWVWQGHPPKVES